MKLFYVCAALVAALFATPALAQELVYHCEDGYVTDQYGRQYSPDFFDTATQRYGRCPVPVIPMYTEPPNPVYNVKVVENNTYRYSGGWGTSRYRFYYDNRSYGRDYDWRDGSNYRSDRRSYSRNRDHSNRRSTGRSYNWNDGNDRSGNTTGYTNPNSSREPYRWQSNNRSSRSSYVDPNRDQRDYRWSDGRSNRETRRSYRESRTIERRMERNNGREVRTVERRVSRERPSSNRGDRPRRRRNRN